MRLLAAFVTAALLSASRGVCHESSLTLHRLQDSDLPVKEAPFALYYSPAAEAEADRYAAVLAEAVDWYRETIGWEGRFAMAVLDDGDYERYAGQGYPVPFAEIVTGLVVMPDDISAFPGFDVWDLEAGHLNQTLTLHEVGHVIAYDIGLWSQSHWVNELMANVFLAGYLRARHPDDRALLEGVPPGFEDAGRTKHLVDLDRLYAGVGLDNYAWFQFRLAEIADHLAADADFATLIRALREAFPSGETGGNNVPTPEESFRRLEAITPGIGAMAAGLVGRPPMPEIGAAACRVEPETRAAEGVLEIENASDRMLYLNERAHVAFMAEMLLMSDLEGAAYDAAVEQATDDAMASDEFAYAVNPGHRRVYADPAGTQLHILGGDCVIVPDRAGRFVWTGG